MVLLSRVPCGFQRAESTSAAVIGTMKWCGGSNGTRNWEISQISISCRGQSGKGIQQYDSIPSGSTG